MTAKRVLLLLLFSLVPSTLATAASKPNIVLVMTDDQGWGQMGYRNHPGRRDWTQSEEYEPYIEAWKNRPEFKPYLNN